ncbi:MAG: hypothetical protein K0S23_1223 [Fluviicola sp.]|jgi:hypothetical protein|uniref:bacteriophage abortive infection AbiH family protein n=1 Tax=Fluviicola sp. TaxID=1917219 RepID=UPI00263210B8|nr:bacteriophage abortive infection AbiH family protein [Fluviicola sp.]MDF3026916.1 hypothetical protein [Fluviicola sp.]
MNPIEKLYVIGNGFDLHHGIRSLYTDFKLYLEEKDNELIEALEKYFIADYLWSDFEATLADLDTEEIVDECLMYFESYGVDDWSDAYHHSYQYEVQKRIDILTSKMKERFTEWIIQLEIPSVLDELVCLDREAYYINFNYTSTLQRLYKIPESRILHIHNKAVDLNSTLILGHSRDPNEQDNLSGYNDEDTDVRIAEGNEILDKYFEETYKSTNTIIKENNSLFRNLANVREIFVLGHSLSLVDQPYFAEIVRNIDTTSVKWTISYYSSKAIGSYEAVMTKLGIDPMLIQYKRIGEIGTMQLSIF